MMSLAMGALRIWMMSRRAGGTVRVAFCLFEGEQGAAGVAPPDCFRSRHRSPQEHRDRPPPTPWPPPPNSWHRREIPHAPPPPVRMTKVAYAIY